MLWLTGGGSLRPCGKIIVSRWMGLAWRWRVPRSWLELAEVTPYLFLNDMPWIVSFWVVDFCWRWVLTPPTTEKKTVRG